MLTAILTVLLFCILIIPHELGHFVAAKLCGVQVNEFSIGMGPLLWQKEGGETRYSIRLIPIGGFCAMEGENEESDNPRAFNNKKAWQKLVILFSGAAMNIMIALLIMIITIAVTGFATNTIDTVSEGGPAAEAGIMPGDRITYIEGNKTDSWNAVVTEISKGEAGREIEIGIVRDGKDRTFTVKPELSDDNRVVVGIQAEISHWFPSAVKYGAVATWNLNKLMIESFKRLFTGRLGADEISGPVGMVNLVNETTNYGFASFLYLVALISLNLAIINLLPFPALDGGRIIFVIIRKITGNMISDDMEGKVHLVGMALLFTFFIVITWNDIVKLFR